VDWRFAASLAAAVFLVAASLEASYRFDVPPLDEDVPDPGRVQRIATLIDHADAFQAEPHAEPTEEDFLKERWPPPAARHRDVTRNDSFWDLPDCSARRPWDDDRPLPWLYGQPVWHPNRSFGLFCDEGVFGHDWQNPDDVHHARWLRFFSSIEPLTRDPLYGMGWGGRRSPGQGPWSPSSVLAIARKARVRIVPVEGSEPVTHALVGLLPSFRTCFALGLRNEPELHGSLRLRISYAGESSIRAEPLAVGLFSDLWGMDLREVIVGCVVSAIDLTNVQGSVPSVFTYTIELDPTPEAASLRELAIAR
jgi:hypothetical protein